MKSIEKLTATNVTTIRAIMCLQNVGAPGSRQVGCRNYLDEETKIFSCSY